MTEPDDLSLFQEAVATIRPDTDLRTWLLGLSAGQRVAVARAFLPEVARDAFSGAIQRCLDEGRPMEAEHLLAAWEQAVGPQSAPEISADLKYWRGEVEVALGRHAAGGEAFEAAASLMSDLDKRNKALANAGFAWMTHGDLSRSERAYVRASEEAATGLRAEGSLRAMLGLAGVAAARGDTSKAIDLLEDAQGFADDTIGGVLRAQIFMEMGVRFAAAGLLDLAGRSYEKARAALDEEPLAAREAGLRDRFLLALDANVRSLSLRLGQTPTPDRMAAPVNPNRSEEAADRLIDARALIAAGDLEAARERAFDALEEAESAGFRDGCLQSRVLISSLLGVQGLHEPALRFADEAIRDLEALRAMAGTTEDRMGFAASRGDLYGMAVDLCRVMNELSGDDAFLDRALSFIEGAKSRALCDMLAGVDLAPPNAVPSSLIAIESQLLHNVGAESHAVAAELQEVWAEMSNLAPDYVAARRGQRVSAEDCKALLAELAAEQ